MGAGIFKKEEAVIDGARAQLEAGAVPADAEDDFRALLASYEKLFKTTKRLVRMSDRSEAELNSLTKDLNNKNQMLEGLSNKLSKYLSPQVYESIFTGERDVELRTERKKLTVFFSDLKDFTSTTENMQPEDLTALLNFYFAEMSQIAIEHGATIDKFIGDAILAFFGDPESHGVQEDARRCVNMAIAMQQRMAELQDIWRNQGFDRPFRMRIGINTGYCNVGNFGSDQRMDYTIIGGEVNLAARLEGNADPDGILVSYETYCQIKDMITTEERDGIAAKGISRPIRAFAVTNILDGGDDTKRFVRADQDGLTLALDLDQLDDDRRASAADVLRDALRRLENS